MTTTVNYGESEPKPETVDLSTSELRKSHIRAGHTAFLGSLRECLWGCRGLDLYLVSYSNVILASNPDITWNGVDNWLVDRWVDIEINVLN